MPQHGTADSTQSSFPWQQYRAPRHWPTRLAIGCLWLLSRLPFNHQLIVGSYLGALLYYLLPSRRRIIRINLRLAFPEQSVDERVKLAKAVYRHIGMGVAETACAWFRPLSYMRDRFEFVGGEHLDNALAAGRGVILLQAHFTMIDICGNFVCSRWPVAAVFDNPKNPLYAAYVAWQRERQVSALIDNRDIRSMIRRLKRGEIVWYSPDQTVRARHGGIATQFFKQPVLTTSGTARIAAMTGATIVPFVPTRHADSGRYTLSFFKPMEISARDTQAATQAVNDLFESQVRTQPEQYLWVHKRFRPPTADLPHPYR